MFNKLEDILIRFEEILGELSEPTVTENQDRFRKLMKEQSDITPVVETYKEYKNSKQDIEDSLLMLEEETDEEMRDMPKEELNIISGTYYYPSVSSDGTLSWSNTGNQKN